MEKMASPYSAALSGCALLAHEFLRVLPLLMSPDSERLVREEVANNAVLQVNSLSSRMRFMSEFRRRYRSVAPAFWETFVTMDAAGQRIGLLYVIIKTYMLVYDFHYNVTMRRWRSVDPTLTHSDLMMEFNELSAADAFVDSWSLSTKRHCASRYLTILRQLGMLDTSTGALCALHAEPVNYAYYLRNDEEWLLECCLLDPYEIDAIKSAVL